MSNILEQINEVQSNIREIKSTWGQTIMTLDNIKTALRTDRQKAIDEAYQKGLNDSAKVQESATDAAYQCGLNAAWQTAKYLFSEMSDTEINLVFPQEWNNGGFKALMALHPQDAIDRINAFERNQEPDEIKVGDEVMYTSTLGLVDNVVGYFFGDSSDRCYKVLRYVDGKFKTGIWNKENCERTGKHSYAVERMVAVMEEGAE